jgi:hypothetical protein
MASLYDELSRKLEQDPRLTRRGVARPDLGLLLFNARAALNQLWAAADRCARSPDGQALADLRDTVETLRPVFGDRHA